MGRIIHIVDTTYMDECHMAKNSKASSAAGEGVTVFPVPFALESFRKDIANVFLHHLRSIASLTDGASAVKILGDQARVDADWMLLGDGDADDVGISYVAIKDTTLAVTMERLYSFAFCGEWDVSGESMGDGSVYTWITALLLEACRGALAVEWCAWYGDDYCESASRCVMVAELANARHTLEGGEPFYTNFGSSATVFEALSIRQMALLSGMEEMSIRSAAGPKRANRLQTHSVDGTTCVNLDVAKEWLISKGRYVQITHRRSTVEIDLVKHRFTEALSLWQALKSHYFAIQIRDGEEATNARFLEAGFPDALPLLESFIRIDDEEFVPESLMRTVADILHLPVDLFVLRCKEVRAAQRLAFIEMDLRNALHQLSTKSQE